MPVPLTPGIWTAHRQGGGSYFIMADAPGRPGEIVATVHSCRESHHDARLMAAAPDLLIDLENGTVAAQAVIDTWESGDLADAVNDLRAWIKQAQETLDKLYAPPPLP